MTFGIILTAWCGFTAGYLAGTEHNLKGGVITTSIATAIYLIGAIVQ